VLALAGCSKHSHAKSATTPSPRLTPPDDAALQRARDLEQLLVASYDAKIATAKARHRPLLEVQRAIHAAHLSALRAKPDAAGITVASNLRHALRSNAHELRGLALAATSGANAALLASIAAAHEVSAS
jgi:hypothetical protein